MTDFLLFPCINFTPWNDSFVKLRDAKFDDTNVLFY